jgi:endonuclease III
LRGHNNSTTCDRQFLSKLKREISFGVVTQIETVSATETVEKWNMSDTQSKQRRKRADVNAVWNILKRRYRDFAHNNKSNPLDELLFIQCSIKTTEANYERAYREFRRAFRTFDEIAKADESAIAGSLHIGGLYWSKARRIKKTFSIIGDAFGKPTLSPLRSMSDSECERFLLTLPGTGVKVARCVMMYSLGRKVFPIDTHCWRIAQRLGWIRAKSKEGLPTSRDMDRLQGKIPPELRFSLHVNFLSLGREFCKSGTPHCSLCPLNTLCPKRPPYQVVHKAARSRKTKESCGDKRDLT